MKKILLSLIATSAIINSQAQYVCDLENFSLTTESAWYGQDQVIDGDTIVLSGNIALENNYNSGWGTFAGWAVSNITDNTTTGWGNQFSAITGQGADGSDNYAICYVSSWYNNRVFNTATAAQQLHGFYITNTTYAYYAMLDGDAFTKPFGADTNAQGVVDGTNGEDWFLLTIYALDEDSLYTGDSVNFYLADYRFSNDADDYIIDEWTWVDLSSLGFVKGLDFVLSSSDTSGGFGMNNPAYIAMDNLSTAFVSVEENTSDDLIVYPNPTQGDLSIQVQPGTLIQIFDMSGKLIFEELSTTSTYQTSIANFENGFYILNTIKNGEVSAEKIVKY